MKKIFVLFSALSLVLMLVACGEDTTTMENDYSYKLGMSAYTHTDGSRGYAEDKNGRARFSTTYVSAVFDDDGTIMDVKIDEVESNVDFDASGALVGYMGGNVQSKKELGDAYGMKAYSGIGKEWYEQIEYLENWLKGKKISDLKKADSRPDSSSAMSGSMSMPATDSGGIVSDATSAINSVADGIMDGAEDLMDSAENMMGFADEDLKAGVTIDTGYIRTALEQAYNDAK